MNTQQQQQTTSPPLQPTAKFMECNDCHTTHVVVPGITDDRPSCKNCGCVNFTPKDKGTPGYMPEFCDQHKDKSIWDGVMAVILGPIHSWKTDMEAKYNIQFTKNDIQELARSITVVGKSMVNQSRDSFTKDRFVNSLKGQWRSFLFSRQRKKKPNYKA